MIYFIIGFIVACVSTYSEIKRLLPEKFKPTTLFIFGLIWFFVSWAAWPGTLLFHAFDEIKSTDN